MFYYQLTEKLGYNTSEVKIMEIIKVAPRGYCKGVIHAISIAKQTAKEYPDKDIYVLGMLVHNRYVMEALNLLGIKTIDDKNSTRIKLLEKIPSGSVVIFTAHGVAPQVKTEAQKRGLIAIDASCCDVVKTQNIVKSHLDNGYEILYIGKKNHPEAEAICALSSHVHLICNKQDIVDLKDFKKVFVTNQTTMSMFDISELFECINEHYPNAIFSEEICNATRIRQQAVADLKGQNIDVLFVVGDKHSNNSTRLAQIALQQNIPHVYRIDDVNDIHEDYLKGVNKVAVTAGASTPTYLTSQVISYLLNFDKEKQKPAIDITKVL